MTHEHPNWKKWLRPSRLVPFLIILTGGSVGVLTLLNLVKTNFVEGIIVALLTLIAIDSLTERLSILEKIESLLENPLESVLLRRRSELPSLEESSFSASEIIILSVCALVLEHTAGLFERKLKEGCKLKFILLDPNSPALDIYDLTVPTSKTRNLIEIALERLGRFVENESCEVRLSPVFYPYSMVVIDPYKKSGQMIVEYHTHKTALDERPHFKFTKLKDAYWFDFYMNELDKIWKESKPLATNSQ